MIRTGIATLLLAAAVSAQETTTEREAAKDVLRKMGDLEKSLEVPALVARLTAPNAARDQVAARAKELMDKELLALADDITRNPEIARRTRVMRLHGIDRDAFDRYTSNKPSWYYQVVAPGFKYNMSDLAASLGIHQLRKAEAFLARRTQLARRYNEELARLPLVLPPSGSDGLQHAWHLYVVRLADDSSAQRDEGQQ